MEGTVVIEGDDVAVQRFPQDRPAGMASDGPSPTLVGVSTDIASGTPELHALLCSYSEIVGTVEKAPAVLWGRPQRARDRTWLRFPAPRALVLTLLTRHICRCVSALRRCAARRVALTNEAPGPLRDLKMLERFEQSLPPGPRLNVIGPIALLGTLLIAFILALGLGSSLSKLFADLITPAVNLDRGAAVEAFRKDHLQPQLYAGVALYIAIAVVLICAALLPAVSAKRQILRGAEDIEARGFAALDCSRVRDFEPGLFAQVLLTGEVVVLGAGLVIFAPVIIRDSPFQGFMHYFVLVICYLTGVGLLCLSAAAAVELRGRYAARRTGTARRQVWHHAITLVSLWLVLGIAVWVWISLVIAALRGGRAI